MSENKYLYSYEIIEVQGTGDLNLSTTPITNYRSNAAPPQIGSFIDPGELSGHGYQEYKVIGVVSIPRTAGNSKVGLEGISDTTYVKVYVKKMKNLLQNMPV